ncbi:hypothetical protein U9M48_012633, partial [Paspalum notatum var. saurae]
ISLAFLFASLAPTHHHRTVRPSVPSTPHVCRTLLLHAHMPPRYWAEADLTSAYLLNRLPCSAIGNSIPFERLFHRMPDYASLQVFGCLCYPNVTATASRKLAPRSTPCALNGYPTFDKCYRYRVIISRHVRLVLRPPGANIVTGKWIFCHKFHVDGSLPRHKARWVVRGFSQQHDIDYDETFSPVVKQATIRVVLNVAGVKNAFLHGHLDEIVYCQQPLGFVDPSAPDHAPRAWYQRFTTYIRHLGFMPAVSDTSLFVYKEGTSTTYLLLYVDDIVLTASSTLLQAIMGQFAMTDLGALHHFLGVSVTRSSGLSLRETVRTRSPAARAGMAECHSTTTPINTPAKLSATDGFLLSLTSRSIGVPLHLTLTRPDLAYAVQQVCLFMHDPREPYLALIKRILRYVKGTLSTGLHLGKTSLQLDRLPRLTTLYFRLLRLPRRKPSLLVVQTPDYGYRHAVAESCWLRQLLQELHVSIASATIVYCDNVSAVYMGGNLVVHHRTKHIEIDIHFVREKVALGQVRVLHVPSSHQFADIMTKGLPALATNTYLLNRRPSSAIHGRTAYNILYGTNPDLDHLRAFGCLCYPNFDTWRLIPRPPGANVVTGKGFSSTSSTPMGRLPATKLAGWSTVFHSSPASTTMRVSPVVKPATIRVVLSITAARAWPIHQLDVKNAFLHGHLEETVYCQQPSGFVNQSAPNHVCLLQKSLYGLKQAPRAWYQRFAAYLRHLGFCRVLLLYVDDTILTASSLTLLRHVTDRLHVEFAMTDLGDLHHFLGISVTRSSDGLVLSHRQ